MTTISQLLLTFLLNACWQVALIAATAMLCARLLRGTAVRYQHLLWVVALIASFCLPAWKSIDVLRSSLFTPQSQITPTQLIGDPELTAGQSDLSANPPSLNPSITMNRDLVVILFTVYFLFVLYRGGKLLWAWRATRAIERSVRPIELVEPLQTIFTRCQRTIGVVRARIVSSDRVSVPITIGVFRPLVILPAGLLRHANDNDLMSAIGHELVHVWRRDYLINLLCELMFVPLSFHPAAALARRRINQTRELTCDELVAEKLLHPEVYARSLVKLAGSAMPFERRATTITVGIADADILEVRIMLLLKRTTFKMRRNRLLLIAAVALLAVPCVAAGAFAPRFTVAPQDYTSVQEPSRQDQEAKDKQKAERQARERQEMQQREDQELKARIANETNPETRAKLEADFTKRLEARAQGENQGGVLFTFEGDPAEMQARRAQEDAEKKARQAELVRLARITMEQAIQAAVARHPGKVLESSLIGEHWVAPDKLADDGKVFYHIVILSGDGTNSTTTHVLVNAIDGTISDAPTGTRQDEIPPPRYGFAERAPISGGVLNGKATTLPLPEYPAIARSAHASGDVTVQVTIDENGNVIAARAVSGHPLLQAAAVAASRQAAFSPTRLRGEPVKVTGVLLYTFTEQ
jgi:TonB family protein